MAMAFLRWLLRLPGRLLQPFVGQFSWQPPGWLRWYGRGLRQRPLLHAGTPLLLALLAGLGWWWWTLPKPVDPEALSIHIEAPELTRWYEEGPQVEPLQLQFSGSAAPLAQIDGEASGVSLQPPLEGRWQWQGDDRLRFDPAEDWPVGQDFQVRIEPPLALGPGVRLADQELSFRTADFKAELNRSEFYQDPLDPSLKRGTWELRFSHPVDVLDFERALALQMVDGAGTAQTAPPLEVRYDERKLVAWVQSGALSVPENGGRLLLKVAADFGAARGGPDNPSAIEGQVALPSLYSVCLQSQATMIVENDQFQPEQVLMLQFNDRLRDTDVAKALRVWLLPAVNPEDQYQRNPYGWSISQVTDDLLARSERITLTALPAEDAWSTQHAFRFKVDPGRRLYVELDRGLRAFGGFLLGEKQRQVQTVPDYPQLLRFVGNGALLSLRGERRISVATRNLPGLALEVARIKPDQLQHLVQYNQGDFDGPSLYSPSVDSLTERFEHRLDLPGSDPARTDYHGIDLGQYFQPDRHGVFLLRLFQHDPANPEDPDQRYPGESWSGQERWDGASDARLVLLTDLGIVAKRQLDNTRQVFVMSLSSGTPVAGATVRAVARNGQALHTVRTGADGRVELPDLSGYRREKQAVMLTVSAGEDLSFLPLDDDGRQLQLSRFDVGGEVNSLDPGNLKAWLFSDRGLYRPGEELHVGMIVRAADWAQPLAGLPLELELYDPRGSQVLRQPLTLDASGFEAASYQPSWTAPTGNWEARLVLLGEQGRRSSLGSTTLQVRDFLPDRLRLKVAFPGAPQQGWVSPEQLLAAISVENLFGTPAQDRRVTANLRLDPAVPGFAAYPGYRFHDPQAASQGFDEALGDSRSDANGRVQLPIDLTRFDRASYQLRLLAQAFEAGGGRGVAAQAQVLVSSNPYLVGLKPEGDLSWLRRGSQMRVHVQAIDPQVQPTAVGGLQAVLIEKRYVSVLTLQPSGLYRYVSQLRSDERSREPLQLAADGNWLALATDRPGDFLLEIRDGEDVLLNRIGWSVAGAADLSRSLERNAELGLLLDKADYAPGERIELSLRAPYTGAGLITIEREKVYAHRWFKADTTASVQSIEVPEGLEGNAYVHVQFLRDPDSAEVHMSPLSYAVAPFSVDRSARRLGLQLSAPARVKPGQVARFRLDPGTSLEGQPAHSTGSARARAVVFAVDEGILQVARHRLGDPLETFFAKRMLQVDTAQILDQLLPEFSQLLAAASAPGGDGEGALAKHLNPFKRKGDKPAVYWSGLVELSGPRDFEFELPDSFNGRIKVMAIAATPARIGLAQAQTEVRADFVLSPNAPQQVAPGDEFEVSVGVAHTLEPAPPGELAIAVGLQVPDSLQLLGEAEQQLSLAAGAESVVRFRLRAGPEPGSPELRFSARGGDGSAERALGLSLRPAWVYRSDLQIAAAEAPLQIEPLRELYPNFARRELNASLSPLIAVPGLGAWLANYPHVCTEQLLSQALPALVYHSHPELGRLQSESTADPFGGVLRTLRERRNGEGSIGLWRAGPEVQPFISAWSALFLIEAGERGLRVPDDLRGGLNGYLERLAGDRARSTPAEFRERALAVYLLTRQGRVTSNLLGSLHEQLQRDLPKGYQSDVTAAFLAASYQLLQQPRPARELLAGPLAWAAEQRRPEDWLLYHRYHDESIARGWLVYLVARHFPDSRERVGKSGIAALLEPIQRRRYNTLSAGLTVLALEAWGTQAPDGELPRLLALAPPPAQPAAFGQRQGMGIGGEFPAGLQALRIEPAADTQAWYALLQAGFDRQAPAAEQGRGIELLRDYLNADGEPVSQAVLGEELTVRLRLRASASDAVEDLAIVELLPGGFELVLNQAAADGDSDPENAAAPAALPTLALPGSTLRTVHTELRDDRIVLYATARRDVQEFRYRVRAIANGRFTLPPAYAESMYLPELYAQGPADSVIEVRAQP